MVRPDRTRAREIAAAQQAALTAETVTQLRQSLAILIPALTGASLEITADILGLSLNRISGLRRRFRSGEEDSPDIPAKHGGRRRALMSIDDEVRFLSRWWSESRSAGDLDVATIHCAYERTVGRAVPKSTIYRLLARHGWRKDTSREKRSL